LGLQKRSQLLAQLSQAFNLQTCSSGSPQSRPASLQQNHQQNMLSLRMMLASLPKKRSLPRMQLLTARPAGVML
jgi:hypothetical protein